MTQTVTSSPDGIDQTSPEWQAHVKEALALEQRFDATRPPCPIFCDRVVCEESHHGTGVAHYQEAALVDTIRDTLSDITVSVRAFRYDGLDSPSESMVDVDIFEKDASVDFFTLTPQQARQLAAELNRSADFADPEPKVPAEQVRVGDWLQVGDDWLYVFCLLIDELVGNVQVFTAADWDNGPTDWEDENPQHFMQGQLVRVRRGGA